jgi:heat shock protein HslJ
MRKVLFSVISICLMFFISCSSSKVQNNSSSLTSNKWSLVSISGKILDTNNPDTKIPFVVFTPDNGFKGFTGCNEFVGSYKYEEGKLTLDQGMMTKMFCADSPETEFLIAIRQTTGYKMSGKELLLLIGTTEVLKFIPKN